jgi:Barrel-sandwich domain of CusB or HlyD membrane-fusion/Heavy metal binding domain
VRNLARTIYKPRVTLFRPVQRPFSIRTAFRVVLRAGRFVQRSRAEFFRRAVFLILLSTTFSVGAHESDRRYTCPMHPDYVATEPGTCPICGMQLVPMTQRSSGLNSREERVPVELQPDQQRILGISVSAARKTLMNRTIRALGKVSMAPPSRIISPCDGAVEQVYQNPGATGSLRMGAGEQILSIACSSEKTTVNAPWPLVLLTVPQPGTQVAQGKELCTVIDLSTMFVLADIRSRDIPFVRSGLAAKATLPPYPGQVWRGYIVEASQQFDERSQVLKVKLQFPNDQPQVWQGMLANIELVSPVGEVLTIPTSAVIADGKSTVVFVKQSPLIFQPRQIEVGFQEDSLVEVKQGLAPGESVVTSATFLLDSESRLRALAQAVDRH